MSQVLWNNGHLSAWKVRGKISAASVAYTEPDGLDYDFRLHLPGRAAIRRGTQMGRAPWPGTAPTFHHAVCYEKLEIEVRPDERVLIPDLLVTSRLREFFTAGRDGTFYFLSPVNPADGCALAFAVSTAGRETADLDGICSIADDAWAGLRQQLLPVIVSAALFLCFFAWAGLSIARRFLPTGALIALVMFPLFIAAGMLVGLALLKKRIMFFPGQAVFRTILADDGWSFPEC